MCWDSLSPTVEKLLKDNPPPLMIVIQLGSNDMGNEKIVGLIKSIKCDILRLRCLIPNTMIVWSDILMRRYWHTAISGKSMELARKRVNSDIKKFMKEEGQFVINHPNIRASEISLYRYDGTHLTDQGNDIYLNNLQGGIEACLPPGLKSPFPTS